MLNSEVSLNGKIISKSNTSTHETGILPSTSLVQVKNNQVVTSSLMVAEHFKKRHSDVLRAIIRLEASRDFIERNFASNFYISELRDGIHKKNPIYYMTRDGFTLLVMGFTGKVAARFKEDYINAFNAMEEAIRVKDSTKYVLDLLEKGLKVVDKRTRNRIQAMKVELGISQLPICDLCYSYKLDRSLSVEDTIKDFLAKVNNTTIDGWHFCFEMLKYRKLYTDIRDTVQGFSSEVYRKYRVWPE